MKSLIHQVEKKLNARIVLLMYVRGVRRDTCATPQVMLIVWGVVKDGHGKFL